MLEVKFYNKNDVEDTQLNFAVIVSKFKENWIYCKHKNRNTWEVPGGHRETGEAILETAKRELYEETGAVDFNLIPVCVYSVKRDTESYGMLYFANILKLVEIPQSEIEKIQLFENIPEKLTYPSIQPKLVEKVIETMSLKKMENK